MRVIPSAQTFWRNIGQGGRLRIPAGYRVLIGVGVGLMLVFSALPMFNLLYRPPGHNKDYDIWYKTGRRVLAGQSLYTAHEQAGQEVFEFMYPPSAAVFLAPLTALGDVPFLAILCLINSAAWIACLTLSVQIAETMGVRRSIGLFVFPAICTVGYVYDAYFLGQPNLVLLACLLGAFVSLQKRNDWAAGGLIALATALKAFPILAVGYFVYRRHWKATFYTVLLLGLFVLALPSAVRGVTRTVDELQLWSGGMLFRYDAQGIAQRPEITYHWKNASLVAAAHRFFRAVPAESLKTGGAIFVNVADLEFDHVSWIVVGCASLLGLACLLLAPRYKNRTPATDAVEFAMLLVLITVLSPISWFYYGIWLLFPLTVIAQFIRSAPRSSLERRVAIGWLVLDLLLLNAIFPWLRPIRSAGLPFFGYLTIFAQLGWMLVVMRRRATNMEALWGAHLEWQGAPGVAKPIPEAVLAAPSSASSDEWMPATGSEDAESWREFAGAEKS